MARSAAATRRRLGGFLEIAAISEIRGVLDDPVILPAHALGIERPELVLGCITTCLFVFDRVHEVGGLEAVRGGSHIRIGEDFDTEILDVQCKLNTHE
jgi:hypothetical protein